MNGLEGIIRHRHFSLGTSSQDMKKECGITCDKGHGSFSKIQQILSHALGVTNEEMGELKPHRGFSSPIAHFLVPFLRRRPPFH